ncbi:MAG: nitrilase-related carbon-nitrogen hydrolase [Planctomycetota bacterium]
MRIALVQPDTIWHDKPANYANLRRLTTDVPAGSVIVMPEMCEVGFTMRKSVSTEGDSATFVRELAAERNCTVIAGVVADGRNQCVIANADGEIVRYAKRKPFVLVDEAKHYPAGTEAVVAEIDGVKFAPSICYDLRHPQVYREPALLGAQVLINVANWPATRVHHWLTLLTARAIENQAWVIGCNRCGKDPYVEYPGRSIIVNPLGEIVADAGADETVVLHDIDITEVDQARNDLPFLHP